MQSKLTQHSKQATTQNLSTNTLKCLAKPLNRRWRPILSD